MTMQPLPNPVAGIANAAKTLNEQANITVKSLSDGFTQATSQLLTQAAQGLPGLPVVPGQAAARGNQAPLAGLQQIVAPFTQLEDVVLPAGLPRPSQLLLGAAAPARPRAPAAPTQPAAPAAERQPTPPAAPVRPRGVSERRGV